MTDPSTDVPKDVPEAAVPQVQQLLNTRANALALGQTDIAASTARQLAALGVDVETAEKKPDAKDEAKSGQAKTEAAKSDEAERALAEARQSAPQGRTTREQQQTTTDTSSKK
jgi:hypothetical protein